MRTLKLQDQRKNANGQAELALTVAPAVAAETKSGINRAKPRPNQKLRAAAESRNVQNVVMNDDSLQGSTNVRTTTKPNWSWTISVKRAKGRIFHHNKFF